MLSEEALVLLIACVGVGLLVLGIWQQLSPVRPRHPERPAPPPGGVRLVPEGRGKAPEDESPGSRAGT